MSWTPYSDRPQPVGSAGQHVVQADVNTQTDEQQNKSGTVIVVTGSFTLTWVQWARVATIRLGGTPGAAFTVSVPATTPNGATAAHRKVTFENKSGKAATIQVVVW